LIAGVKTLPPVGLMLFSVGEGAAVLDCGDVVVVVVVIGAWLLLLPHPAVTAPTTTRATPAAAAIARRSVRLEFMVNILFPP
jgi:hypothetical protein